MDFIDIAKQCAPTVNHHTMQAIVRVESGFNPYAIGVVGGSLERQPKNKAEAILTAKELEKNGWNFSLGAGQVNKKNLPKYGLDYEKAFELCDNLRASSEIFKECYDRALKVTGKGNEQTALRHGMSCYYSGNFSTGYKQDFKGQPSYVSKVLASAGVDSSLKTTTPAAIKLRNSAPVAATKTETETPAPSRKTAPRKDFGMKDGFTDKIEEGFDFESASSEGVEKGGG